MTTMISHTSVAESAMSLSVNGLHLCPSKGAPAKFPGAIADGCSRAAGSIDRVLAQTRLAELGERERPALLS